MIRKFSVVALLVLGCGRQEVGIDTAEVPTAPPSQSNESEATKLLEVARTLVELVEAYGYPVAHFDHAAKYTIDTALIEKFEDRHEIERGSVLAMANCQDYRTYCWATFRDSVVGTAEINQIVYHETLHMLGFRHEDCESQDCEGIMGPVLNTEFNLIEPADITEEYLKKIPWVRPIQPTDEGVTP